MSGLKKHYSDIRFSGNKVTPDEMDRYERIYIMHPGTAVAWFGTAAGGTSAQAKAFVLTNQQADYPRTLLLTVAGTGTDGSTSTGTAAITGTDQFGKAITESISFSGTTGTASAAGTGIFKTVTAGTVTFGTATVTAGSASLGLATGTATGQVARFGLGAKIGATGDVKMITWLNNGDVTAMNAGTTIASLVSATSHSFQGTSIVGTTDSYFVEFVPSYNAESEVNMAS